MKLTVKLAIACATLSVIGVLTHALPIYDSAVQERTLTRADEGVKMPGNTSAQLDQLDARGLDDVIQGAFKSSKRLDATAPSSSNAAPDLGASLSEGAMQHDLLSSKPLKAKPSWSRRISTRAGRFASGITRFRISGGKLKAASHGNGKGKAITTEHDDEQIHPMHRLHEWLGIQPPRLRPLGRQADAPSSSSSASTADTPRSSDYSYHDHFDDDDEAMQAQKNARTEFLHKTDGLDISEERREATLAEGMRKWYASYRKKELAHKRAFAVHRGEDPKSIELPNLTYSEILGKYRRAMQSKMFMEEARQRYGFRM